MEKVDVLVIGGGPGGYTAALKAARAGLKTALAERGELGGTCLNRGCIPTKALLKSAEYLRLPEKAADFGAAMNVACAGWRQALDRKNAVIEQSRKGILQLLKSAGVIFYHGEAVFSNANEAEIHLRSEAGEQVIHRIQFRYAVIASGSHPKSIGMDGEIPAGVYSSDSILELDEIPEKLAIIGGGVIGVEMATIFSAFGSSVTILEFLPQILNGTDTDIVKRYLPFLRKQGVNVQCNAQVLSVYRQNGQLQIRYQVKHNEELLLADAVLIAAGRAANIPRGLECAGVAVERGWLACDENYRTANAGIYAIGDVNGRKLLAHAAEWQGKLAIEDIARREGSENGTAENQVVIPACVFTRPEIAMAGKTEEELRTDATEYVSGKAMYGANGKASAEGHPEGFVKLLAGKADGKILGVHVLGAHASDIVAAAVIAMQWGVTAQQVAATVFAHPTYSELLHSAAEDACEKLRGR